MNQRSKTRKNGLSLEADTYSASISQTKTLLSNLKVGFTLRDVSRSITSSLAPLRYEEAQEKRVPHSLVLLPQQYR